MTKARRSPVSENRRPVQMGLWNVFSATPSTTPAAVSQFGMRRERMSKAAATVTNVRSVAAMSGGGKLRLN